MEGHGSRTRFLTISACTRGVARDGRLSEWLHGQPESIRTFHDDVKAPSIKPLLNVREGYPWLIPHHRLSDPGGMLFFGHDW